MSPEVAASYNRTKIGGNAFNQNAALQIILTRKGIAKQGTDKVGTIIKATVAKNSYGPEGGMFEFEVISRPYMDTESYKQPSLYFANTTCAWLATNRYCGVTESRKRYSCDALGLVGLKADEFYVEFSKSHLKDELCTQLNVIGYPVEDSSSTQLEKLEGDPDNEDDEVSTVSDAEIGKE